MRIELTPQAWEAHVLPLNYTRFAFGERDNHGEPSLARQNFGDFSHGPGDFFGDPKKIEKKACKGQEFRLF
jgi:hypothetical protein